MPAPESGVGADHVGAATAGTARASESPQASSDRADDPFHVTSVVPGEAIALEARSAVILLEVTEVIRTVGRFELLREVGRGGMAVVWLARQTDLDRMVALKELAPFHAADPAFAARFLRESRIAGSLNHPNIVTVHDYLESENVPFISMEYMEHGSLRPLVGQLTLAQVAYVLEGMLAALAYAESHGIVHRDLKPENVMVRADGQVKIADFGIAKAFNQASSTGFHTVTGTTVGTPAYMAPEQAMAKELGPWTDLYSTGVVAYELLVGQVPFSDTETPVAILLRHVNDPPPAPRSIRPDLDEGIEAWLLKMLAKNPADRFQHATDAWDAFEEIVVTVVGPRWRRDARILGLGGGSYTPTPTPLPSIPKMADAGAGERAASASATTTADAHPNAAAGGARAGPRCAGRTGHAPSRHAAPRQRRRRSTRSTRPSRYPRWRRSSHRRPTASSGLRWRPRPRRRPPGRSRRPLVIGAGLLVLIGAGIAAAVSLTGGGLVGPLDRHLVVHLDADRRRRAPRRPGRSCPIPRCRRPRRPALIGAGRCAVRDLPGRPGRAPERSLAAPARDRIRRLAAARARSARPHADRGRRQDAVPAAERHARTGRRVGVRAGAARRRWREGLRSSPRPADASASSGRPAPARACAPRSSRPGWERARAAPCSRSTARTGHWRRSAARARSSWRAAPRSSSGKRAHGPVVVVGSRAYVPVSRGIAVVDLATRKVTSTIPLQVTPGAPALVGGTIVAPLPARGGVALDLERGQGGGPEVRRDGPARLRRRGGNRLAGLRRERRRRDDHAGRRREGEGACAVCGSRRCAAPRSRGRSSGAVP